MKDASVRVELGQFLILLITIQNTESVATFRKVQTESKVVFPQHEPIFCYKCISLNCPPENEDCASVEEFVQASLEWYYQIEAIPQLLPICPAPADEVGWETLKTVAPNGIKCRGPCTVGRFEIRAVIGTRENVTWYGTVMGCPKPKLLQAILRPPKNPPGMRPGCRLDNTTSDELKGGSWGMGIEMTLEHCGRLGDICNNDDYCLDRSRSIVVPFGGEPPRTIWIGGFVFWAMFAIGILGVVIVLVSFASMKFDAY